MSAPPPPPVRDGSREGSAAARACPICATVLASPRARYCSRACQQRSYRLRRPPLAPPDTTALAAALRRAGALAAHTVYECPDCDARSLGVQRCDACNRFCRALGLGGACPDCEAPVLLADLLGREVLP